MRASAKALIALGAITLIAFTLALGPLIDRLGGASRQDPTLLETRLSPGARALVDAAFTELEGDRVDHHVHIAGIGAGGTGAEVNPNMQSPWHPLARLKFEIYKSAAGIKDMERADAEYVERLVTLIRSMPEPGRVHIMAFDKHYDREGVSVPEKTEFYVPNAYIFAIAERHPDILHPVMSVHPYRRDALEALERWSKQGGRFIKWLPNAMGMDPADPAIDPFYEKMKALKLVLLSHAGEEKAVHAEEDQALGNPLRLRRPLDMGVTVVVAHCASLGLGADLDSPGGPPVPNFELFLRLMSEPRYEGLLFGEISAMTQANRLFTPLERLMETPALHHRLINGSDYPLPAINAIIRTGKLEDGGFLNAEDRAHLNEIYDFNPLLFDFVLKRTIRTPSGARLPPQVFTATVSVL